MKSERPDESERLTRIEGLLEDLMERQRISRLDTVMFLAYPVIISGTILLVNATSQWETLGRIKILTVSFQSLFLFLGLFFGFGLVLTFVAFIRAYVADDLRGRYRSCRWFFGQTFTAVLLVLLLPMGSVTELAERYSSLPSLGNIIPLVFMFATIQLWDNIAVPRMRKSTSMWFVSNLPRRSEAENVTVEFSSRGDEFGTRLGKIIWFIGYLGYGLIVIDSIFRHGLVGSIGYHAIAGAVLLAGIIYVQRNSIKLRIRDFT